jgi:glycerol-3-phosphate dehydrogenase
MAEETIDKAIEAGLIDRKKCMTRDLKLISVPVGNSPGRLHIYGDHSGDIKELIRAVPGLGMPVSKELPYTRAEFIWICRNEMPLNLEDILARRTRALILNARASEAIAPEVAELMAEELGFDEKWQTEQVNAYKELVKNYI